MGRSNRVEELETQVRELEATVTGLTDELLECKQRLGELEDAVEEAGEPIEGSLMSSSDSDSDSDADATESTSLLADIDTDTTEESETETEQESDEIIVA